MSIMRLNQPRLGALSPSSRPILPPLSMSPPSVVSVFAAFSSLEPLLMMSAVLLLIFSSNEFLTRINLMKAYLDGAKTPLYRPKKAVVVGGGNVAMDSARCAKRLGADVTIVYRRTLNELPARKEEVENAIEEGIEIKTLTNPIEILVDETGWVKGVRCEVMELGEKDASGRAQAVSTGKEIIIEADSFIIAIGTTPNPLIKNSAKGLTTSPKGCIKVDEDGLTSLVGIYAGGDAVTGSATIILAMGAGKNSAKAIDEYIKNKGK